MNNLLCDRTDIEGSLPSETPGTHSGAGIIDVDYRARDKTDARRLLAEVMGEITPEVNYTVYRMLG